MTQTFTVENYKGIVGEVSLSPNDSNLIVIAGANGAGKSSFIDPLKELIKYKGSKLTPQPIRDGEDEARAEFTDTDLGVRLERVWKRGKDGTIKSTFSAYALDGARYPSAVDLVAELTGGEIIDPVEFTLLDEKKQRDVLLAKVDLPFDLEEIGRQRLGAFDERTDVNRHLKQLEGELAGRVKPDDDTPTGEVSAADILAEFEAARQHNATIDRQVNDLAALESGLERVKERVARLEAELTEAREGFATVQGAYDRQLAVVHSAELIDTADISTRLAGVEQTNAAIRAANEYRRVAADVERVRAESEALTAKLDEIDAKKKAGLAAAVFPSAGLSVDDEGVTVNGTPFIQLNDAERISTGFDIATSGNPKLKLIFIKAGDMLDDDTLARIAARGQERGYTIVTERGRDNSSEIGFTFNEGQVQA